jgi:lambda repressor-like predicted transcriptional regulator
MNEMSQLQQVMKEKKMRTIDLMYKAGCSFYTIYGVLRHGHKPKPAVRERIAQALGVTPTGIWPDTEGK